MRSKEEYYELVLKNRELAADARVTNRTCPNTLCEWHGRCKKCVALHRYHNDHIPVCLQPLINDKLKALVGVGELVAIEKERTPLEYRYYVRERDQAAQKLPKRMRSSQSKISMALPKDDHNNNEVIRCIHKKMHESHHAFFCLVTVDETPIMKED